MSKQYDYTQVDTGDPVVKSADKHHENVELQQDISRRTLGGFFIALPMLAAVPAVAQTDAAATSILRSLAPHDSGQVSGGGSSRGRVAARPRRPMPHRVRTRGGFGQEIEIDLSRRVEVTVFFENNSAELLSSARSALLRLALALRHPVLINEHFLIAGHTSADGNYDYNVELSQDRAAAVRNWLVSYGEIAGSRLVAHGFGPDMLRNPRNPYSPVNRRVEVIAITG